MGKETGCFLFPCDFLKCDLSIRCVAILALSYSYSMFVIASVSGCSSKFQKFFYCRTGKEECVVFLELFNIS